MAKKWIQSVVKSMKKKGTEGSFKRYCGGKVTRECIERGKNSPNPTIRARARLAETLLKMHKKEEGGEVIKGFEFLDGLLNNRKINEISKYAAGNKRLLNSMLEEDSGVETLPPGDNPVDKLLKLITESIKNNKMTDRDFFYIKQYSENIKKAYRNANIDDDMKKDIIERIDKITSLLDYAYFSSDDKSNIDMSLHADDILKIYDTSKDFIKKIPSIDVEPVDISDIEKDVDEIRNKNKTYLPFKFKYGGTTRSYYDEGGDVMNASSQQQQPATPSNISSQNATTIQPQQVTYEQYVSFVMQYPEYFQRLLIELNEYSNRQQEATTP